MTDVPLQHRAENSRVFTQQNPKWTSLSTYLTSPSLLPFHFPDLYLNFAMGSQEPGSGSHRSPELQHNWVLSPENSPQLFKEESSFLKAWRQMVSLMLIVTCRGFCTKGCWSLNTERTLMVAGWKPTSRMPSLALSFHSLVSCVFSQLPKQCQLNTNLCKWWTDQLTKFSSAAVCLQMRRHPNLNPYLILSANTHLLIKQDLLWAG